MDEEIINGNPEEDTGQSTRAELERLKAEIRARKLLSEAELPEDALNLLDMNAPETLETRVNALRALVGREASRLCEQRLAGMAPSPLAAPVNYDKMSDREYYALKLR